MFLPLIMFRLCNNCSNICVFLLYQHIFCYRYIFDSTYASHYKKKYASCGPETHIFCHYIFKHVSQLNLPTSVSLTSVRLYDCKKCLLNLLKSRLRLVSGAVGSFSVMYKSDGIKSGLYAGWYNSTMLYSFIIGLISAANHDVTQQIFLVWKNHFIFQEVFYADCVLRRASNVLIASKTLVGYATYVLVLAIVEPTLLILKLQNG